VEGRLPGARAARFTPGYHIAGLRLWGMAWFACERRDFRGSLHLTFGSSALLHFVFTLATTRNRSVLRFGQMTKSIPSTSDYRSVVGPLGPKVRNVIARAEASNASGRPG
jgi:hypothetical protein